MPIGILNREFTIAPRNKAEELIREFFYSEITRQIDIDDGDAYNVTIAIGNFFFGKGIVGDRDNLLGVPIIGGVIYPSVAGKTISNVTTYNFAIPPKIFDRYFEIFEATIYCLTNEESHYQLNDVNKSVSLDSDGTIRWQFDFAEMKHRIAAGLCLNGTCKSLIHLEEQA